MPINLNNLTEGDVGRRVWYYPNHSPDTATESGRIKAFTDKYIFVHFDGGGDTAKACYPENLEWAESLLDLSSHELLKRAIKDLKEVINDKS